MPDEASCAADIRPVRTAAAWAAVRDLCRGYRATLAVATQDRPEVVETYYSTESYEALLTRLPELHAPPRGECWLAYHDGAPLGCGMIHEIAPQVVEIKRVFTDPGARGQGLGRALCLHAMDHARTGGARRMVLDTMRPLTAAISLYESLGFRPTEPFYDLDPRFADYIRFFERDL